MGSQNAGLYKPDAARSQWRSGAGIFGLGPTAIHPRKTTHNAYLSNVGYTVLTDTIVLTERNIKTLPKLHLSRLGKPQHDILPFVTLILAEQQNFT